LLAFAASVLIALASVGRRLYALSHPSSSGPPQLLALDRTFASHATLTSLHIVPAALFVIVAAIYVLRNRARDWLYPLGAVVATTAYFMNAYAVGGSIERAAVLTFNTWFLVSLAISFRFRLRGEAVPARRWLLRAIGVLFGFATTRPVMGAFFATSSLTHLGPQQFFGWAFWIGFTLNVIATELLLNRKPLPKQGLMTAG
ncbi:MAG: DUF2306 domain-containing protein, partial [Acidobacteriales bacterium]|nr:DUF2306 domain-containing protein [Terriglobales bacterium]